MKLIKLADGEKGTRIDTCNSWSTLDKVFTNLKANDSTTLKNYSTSDHVPVKTEVYVVINKIFKRETVERLPAVFDLDKVTELMINS